MKAALFGGAALAAVGVFGPAAAQDANPAQPSEEAAIAQQEGDEDVGEEGNVVGSVVVTARRREETLQDTPVAVTAYTEQRLEQTGARDITALQQSTPNLTLQVARGSNSTLIAFIRGVGQQDPLWGFEPGVGLYVDDVYVARPQGAVLDIFDVQRIEVLRGPQGTLYGRNTIGGAVKYVTKKIGADPDLRLRTNIGTYGQFDVIANGSMRLNDMWGVSAALASYSREGYGTNLNTGAEHYNRDALAGRFSVEFTPTDSLFFRLSADRTVDDSNPRHGHREVATPTVPVLANAYDTRAGSGDENRVWTEGVSLLGEWEMNEQLTFKSITALRQGKTRGTIDFDNLPQPILDIPAFYADEQFTQEFQVLLDRGRLTGVAGLFFLDATAQGAFDTVIGLANLTTLTRGEVQTESLAAFADFSFEFTDQLSASLGGRWTRDDKTATQFRQNYLGIRSPFFGNAGAVALGAPRTNYTRSKSFEQFTPRVSVTYEATPDLTAYASYARGFKSGGFDMRGDAVLYPATVEGYEPELVDTYEAGLKGALLDGRVNFATALFKSEYTDQQITSQFVIPPATIVSFVDNAGSSELWGGEFEASARLHERLSANLAVGYIDAQFNEFLTFDPTCVPPPGTPPSQLVEVCRSNLASQRDFQNTPEWTGYVDLTWRQPLGAGWGELAVTPALSYRGAYQMFEIADANLDQDSFTLVDLTLLWTSETGRYRAGLSGRNLTDERYRVGGYNFPAAITGTSVIGFYGPPRTWTASFEVRF